MKQHLVHIYRSILQSNDWYQSKFRDCYKFWERFPFNLDVVNLGSNTAFYGFDYTSFPVKGANWAMRPQSFPQDFAILKTYYSYLRPRAIILIALGPYSSCYKNYKDLELEKYYTILHPGTFEGFSLQRCSEIYELKRHPFVKAPYKMTYGTIRQIGKLICKRTDPAKIMKQKLDTQGLEQDALKWINGWQQQFGIEDMNAPLPAHIVAGRQKRVSILREIIQFCKERDLRPFIVLPPVTKYLSEKFSDIFRRNYIYTFLQEAGIEDNMFLDYLDNIPLSDEKLYFNSFFLNRRGSRVFTERVLHDVGLL